MNHFLKRIRYFPTRSLSNLSKSSYKENFQLSITNPTEFWAEKADDLVWYKKYDRVIVNPDSPNPQWFQGGLLNTCYNCLDRHIEDGFGSQIAVIEDSPVTECKTTYSYAALGDTVSRLAGFMSRKCGVRAGDRIIIYMPMITQCLIAMLAAARLGAIHSVVFGGFSPEQLLVRIDNAKPRLIVTASYGIEKGKLLNYKDSIEEALKKSSVAKEITHCIFYNRSNLPQVELPRGDFYVQWGEAIASRPHDPVPVKASDPLYVLYTSGTTGDPKGVVRDNGGNAVALKYSASRIYDIQPGDVWWALSEFGWVVGHSFCGYGPLLQRATSILYEGKPIGTPDAAQCFRVLHDYGVSGWFLTPSAARAIRSIDPLFEESKRYRLTEPGLSRLRNVFVAGEHCDVSTIEWLASGLPPSTKVSDTWWQTETGWPITASCLTYPGGFKEGGGAGAGGVLPPLGSAGLPVPGYNVQFAESKQTGADSHTEPDEHMKQILIKLPMPPGTVTTLWNDDDRFHELYFKKYPGYYDTMDFGYADEDGYVYVVSRSDDVINVSGHRLSTSALEEACFLVEGIVDCAVIPIPHDVKGQVPLGVLVQNPNSSLSSEEIVKEVIRSVRKVVGPVAAFNQACVVPKLPKTRSGKISRASLTDMAFGKPVRVPVTIEDIGVYGAIHDAFKACGLKPTAPPRKL